MTLSEIIRELSAADRGASALRCLRLFDLSPVFFNSLREEVADLLLKERPSDVGDRNHVTHWTRPRGHILQFSLLNRSGRCDDTSADHDLSCRDKRFHFPARYPTVASLATSFPHSINLRLNILFPGASLSPHREPVCFRARNATIGVRLRLHLPLETNEAAEIVLDNQVYHFQAGQITLFNQGCVHSAANRGKTNRVHLVWDVLLTAPTAQTLFGLDAPSFPALRCSPAERWLSPTRTVRESLVVGLAPLVDEAEIALAAVVEPQ